MPRGNIVYLDARHNVWVADVTGTIKRQLTTDGLTEGYTSPSETDAGVIVVPGTRARFFYLRLCLSKPQGTVMEVLAPTSR